MITNVQICVTLILLSRAALARRDEKACEVYGEAMKHFIRTRGITAKDCDTAFLFIQTMHNHKPTIRMANVIPIHRERGTINTTGESNEAH